MEQTRQKKWLLIILSVVFIMCTAVSIIFMMPQKVNVASATSYTYTYDGSSWDNSPQSSYNKGDQLSFTSNSILTEVHNNIDGYDAAEDYAKGNPYNYTVKNDGATVSFNGDYFYIMDKYNIAFSATDKTSGTEPTIDGTYFIGNKITLPSGGDLARTGYTFAGWYQYKNGAIDTYKAYESGTEFTLSYSNKDDTDTITFYAVWEEVTSTTYTITYSSSGWDVTPQASYNAGDTIKMVSNTVQSGFLNVNGTKLYHPTKLGSWTKEYVIQNDGATLVLEGNGNFGTANITDGYKLTYDDNVSTEEITMPTDSNYYGNPYEYNSVTYIFETATITSTIPARANYEFVSWNTKADGSGTSYYAGDNLTITEDTTLYAIWEKTDFAIDAISMTLQNNLQMNYKVKSTILTNGYSNPYITFTLNGEDTEVSTYETVGDYLVFSFTNIEGKYMADKITAVLSATKGGKVVSASAVSKSIQDYCKDLLADETSKTLLSTLVVDVLNYGSACQIYNGYNTGSLANAVLTNTQKGWATSQRTYLTCLNTASATASDGTSIAGAQMLLDNAINMQIFVGATNLSNLTMEFYDGSTKIGNTVTITSGLETITNPNNNKKYYLVNFVGLNASQLSNNITIKLLRSGSVIATATYSMESYASAKWDVEEQGEAEDEHEDGTINLGQLIIAVMKYGDSARAYKNNGSIPVTGVTLDYSKLTLGIDESETLDATIIPTNAETQDVTWSTSDSNVATVENGVVTGISAGTATITVTTVDGGYTATCLVTVEAETVLVTSITLDKTKLYYGIDEVTNEDVQLTATIGPDDATNKTLNWTSSNTSVVTVDSTGLVTILNTNYVYNVTITATATDDSGVSATCTIYIDYYTFVESQNVYVEYGADEHLHSTWGDARALSDGLIYQVSYIQNVNFKKAPTGNIGAPSLRTGFAESKIVKDSDGKVMYVIGKPLANADAITINFYATDKIYGSNSGFRDNGNAKEDDIVGLFEDINLYSADFTNFDTSNITDMRRMFKNASATTLDLSTFDTSKVTNMSGMFTYCEILTSVNLSSFDTSKVTIMSNMFNGCKMLTSLDLSTFNTGLVTAMDSMFNYCKKLATLTLPDTFTTANVTNFSAMFSNCLKLTSIDQLSNFDTSSATNMGLMFNACGATSLDVSNFDTSKVTIFTYMFANMGVTTLDLTSFVITSSADLNMVYMFTGCEDLTTIYCNDDWTGLGDGTIGGGMFVECDSLTNHDVGYDDLRKAYAGEGGAFTSTVITATLTNVTGANANPTFASPTHNTSLTFTASSGYKLPSSVSVVGATLVSWTQSTGVLIISNPTGNVTITVTGKKDITLKALQQTLTVSTTQYTVNFLPVFDDGKLSSVLGTAKFYDKNGNELTDCNTATSMSALATAISDAGGIGSVYLGGTPTGKFYGTIVGSVSTFFVQNEGASKGDTLQIQSAVTTALSGNLGNVCTGAGSGDLKWSKVGTSPSDTPTLNSKTITDIYNAYGSLFCSKYSFLTSTVGSSATNVRCYNCSTAKWSTASFLSSSTFGFIVTNTFSA